MTIRRFAFLSFIWGIPLQQKTKIKTYCIYRKMDGNKTTLLISIFSPFDLRHTKKGIWRFWYFHVVVSVFSFEGEVRETTKERSKPVIFHVKGPKDKPVFTFLSFRSSVYLILFEIYKTHQRTAVTLSAKTNGTFKKLWFFIAWHF